MIEVNKETLEDLVSGNERVFVYFYSEWNGRSKMMFTTLRVLQNQIDVPIAICNIDYNYDLGEIYKVRGLPSFGLVYQGEIVKLESSVRTLEFLRNFILE